MKPSKLSKWDLVGAAGSVVLVLALIFLPWFDIPEPEPGTSRAEGEDFICGVDDFECTGFETFSILRWLLIAGATAPIILAYLVSTGARLSWTPGEVTMVVGFIAFVLIGFNGVIDKPGSGGQEVGVSLDIGYYAALLSAIAISMAGVARLVEANQDVRKTPGTV